jgi:hypothetical protein
MRRGARDLAPIAGLCTLLEKAELLDRYSDAARCCADLGVKKLVDLHMEAVRQELSKRLALKFFEKERLRLECADEAMLHAYAANESDIALAAEPASLQTMVPLGAAVATACQRGDAELHWWRWHACVWPRAGDLPTIASHYPRHARV